MIDGVSPSAVASVRPYFDLIRIHRDNRDSSLTTQLKKSFAIISEHAHDDVLLPYPQHGPLNTPLPAIISREDRARTIAQKRSAVHYMPTSSPAMQGTITFALDKRPLVPTLPPLRRSIAKRLVFNILPLRAKDRPSVSVNSPYPPPHSGFCPSFFKFPYPALMGDCVR